jgi:maleamate amidohydrolase
VTEAPISTAPAPPYGGYGAGAIGPGTRPAIVVVDFQEAFTTDALGMGGGPMIDSAVARTARLLEVARAHGVPVLQTVVAFRPDGSDLGHWAAKMPALRDLVTGSPLVHVDPRLADERDVVLVKHWPSAFHGTPLGALLRVRGVDTIIVCGCTTSGCVRATIVDGFSEGYRVLVPIDAVGDHDVEPHEANLRDCGRRYCDLTSVDEVAEYLQRVGVAR